MKNTVVTFKQAKENGEKLTMLTAYDYSTAKLMDKAGINGILVGDSLGMVCLGYEDTISVTMEDMIHHSRAVARGCKDTLVVCDMPFMSYQVSVEQAVINAGRLIKEGRAQMVKLEGGPDGVIVENTLLPVHAVFGDIFAGDPPLGGEVIGIAGVQEAVIAGVGQEGFKRKGNDGEDAGKEGNDDENNGDDYTTGTPQIDLGDLTGLAGDGGVVLATFEAALIEQHDSHAEDHHNDGKDTGFAGIFGVHGYILGGKGGKTQIMRDGVGTHGAAEHQQNGGKNGGLDHGQGDAEHGFPLGGIQNGSGFLKVSIHIAEDAADEDIGKGRIVQAQYDQAGEQSLAPPQRHLNIEQGGEQTVAGAGNGIGIEKVLPHDRQSPLGHDVGEDEDGA